jgi:Na+-translocating ferredoxin:NAD+ oxidoreductase RnfG subunit
MNSALLFFFFFFQVGNSLYDQAEVLIKKNIQDITLIKRSSYKIVPNIKSEIEKSAGQKFFNDELIYWKIFTQNKQLKYAFIDNVYGKTLPITFLVILDEEEKVQKVEIIKYREQYGTGIKNENWLNQFINFNSSSDFTIGKDVQGISGATISANSISRGVKKIVKLFGKIKNEL